MDAAVQGDNQLYSVLPSDRVRAHWIEGRPKLATLMQFMSAEGQGQNIVHQKKKISDEECSVCAQRFGIPLTDEQIKRADLSGYQSIRQVECPSLPALETK